MLPGYRLTLSLARRFLVAIQQVYEDRFLHDSHITLPTKHPPSYRWRQRFLSPCSGLLPIQSVEFPASLLTANTLREFSEVQCLTEIDVSVIHRDIVGDPQGSEFNRLGHPV